MIVWLNVPFKQKDEARRLGAQWNDARKTWYVENAEDLKPFMKWIDDRVKEPTTKVAARPPKFVRPAPTELASKRPKKGAQKKKGTAKNAGINTDTSLPFLQRIEEWRRNQNK